jgi:hypothetical protein
VEGYFLRVAAWISQGLHCLILGGHHDMTVSARCYVEYRLRGNQRWRTAHNSINWVFRKALKQNEHCMNSFLDDEQYARQVLKMSSLKGQQ